MANTYSQIYLHIVFTVKNRESLIPPHHQQRVHKYITKIINNLGHHAITVGGTDTHIHLLIRYNINHLIKDLVKELKVSSTKFINEERLTPFHFQWQKGYGCFSNSPQHIDHLINYIAKQYEHHKSISLEDEMKRILDSYKIEYDMRYIMKDPE